MMGTKQRVFSTLPRDVSLEDLVPKDGFYRRLEATLDLSFVRELVAPLYAGGGRPSVDPVVFFKLQLVMFFEDLRSERQLMEVVSDRLSLRWYLGYDLHEPLPDHSSLTRNRGRYGLEVFRRFFERIVEMFAEAGLVWGEEMFVDSTTVRANAAKAALVPRFAAREHVDALFHEEPPDAAGKTEEADAALPDADDGNLQAANAARKDFVSSAGRHGTKSRTPNPNKISDHVVNRTDPDACLTGHVKGTARTGLQGPLRGGRRQGQGHPRGPGHQGRREGQPADAGPYLVHNLPLEAEAASRHRRLRLRHHPQREALEQAGIRAYMPVIDYTWGKRTLFRKDDFVYDAERDVYWCPAGEILRNTGARRSSGSPATWRIPRSATPAP